MQKVKLIEKQPFFYKNNVTWYDKDTIFDVLETKTYIGLKDIFYKVSYEGFPLDGFVNSKSFEDLNDEDVN